VWLHLLSDSIIALAYYSIPLTLLYFVQKRQDLPFLQVFWLFGAFIVACGTTHLMEVWTLWHPTYWLSGAIKALTAVISLYTAAILVPLVPQALALPSPAQMAIATQALTVQIAERERAEASLRIAYDDLELRIQERTVELAQANQVLQTEIAERKQSEKALAQKAQELARSNEELERFAYVASHDLQEPLRMVVSYLQLLERRYQGQLDATANEFIGYAVDGASRMQTLIRDLLSYSRVGTRTQAFALTDSADVVDKAIANLQMAIAKSAAVITHNSLPEVMVDSSQFAQLFQNLMGNAIKFHGEQPPQIHISAERIADGWQFSVRDNGIGIEPEYTERIFVIFQRLHRRADYPGTGIGLAICKKIVERHGGRLWIESELGQGSVFYFTIPDRAALR
jgi:signal transduction histidine kinase